MILEKQRITDLFRKDTDSKNMLYSMSKSVKSRFILKSKFQKDLRKSLERTIASPKQRLI